jgi:hypothetical protein
MLVPLPSIGELRYPGQPGTCLSLMWESGDLQSVCAGGEEFAVTGGQPVLIDFSNSLCRKKWFARARKTMSVIGERSNLARTIKGTLTGSRCASGDNILRFKALLPTRPVVLMVGAGTIGAGCEDLYERSIRPADRLRHLPLGSDAILAHTHQIPMADASVDGVIIQAVLEHVLEPAAVAEIDRVLKPRKIVYAGTPFLQQVHEGAYDFTESIAARRIRFLLSRSASVRLVQHSYAQWRVQPPTKSGAPRLACDSCS